MNETTKPSGDLRYFLFYGLSSASILGMNGLLNLVTRRTLSNGLPMADFGLFYTVFSAFSVLSALLEFGLGQSATILIGKYRSLGDDRRAGWVFGSLLRFRALFGAAVAASIAVGSIFFAKAVFQSPAAGRVVAWLSLWLFANLLMGCSFAVFDALKRPIARNGTLLAHYALVFMFVQALAASGRLNLGAGAAAFATGLGIPVAFSLAFVGKRLGFSPFALPLPSAGVGREIAGLGKWVAVSSAGTIFVANLDTLLLFRIAGYEMVAEYNVALPIMQIALGFFLLIPQLATPLLIRSWYRGDAKRFRRTSVVVSLFCLASSAAFWPLAALFAKKAISLIFGARYAYLSGVAGLLLVGVPLNAAGLALQTALNVAGRQRTAALITVSSIGVSAALNFALIPGLGARGAAVANLATNSSAFLALLVVVLAAGRGGDSNSSAQSAWKELDTTL